MRDDELTYFLLILLYLIECCRVAGKDTLLFLPDTFKRLWRMRRVDKGWAIKNGYVVVLPPLTPWRTGIFYSPSPLLFHPDCIFNRYTGRSIAWHDLTSASVDGKSLYLNGDVFATYKLERQAEQACRQVLTISAATPQKRPGLITAMIRPKGTPSHLARLVRLTNRLCAPLYVCSALQLLLMFAAPLYFVRRFEPGVSFLVSAGFIFLMGWVIAVLFRYAHKKLYPAERWERRLKLIHYMLYPPATPVAIQAITNRLGMRIHPAVRCAALLSDDQCKAQLARLLRECQYPILPHAISAESTQLMREAYRREYDTLHAYLTRHSILPPEESPVIEDGHNCTHYCPRCLSVYRTDNPTCPACRGIALHPLPHGQD